jgi:hypothetical protein
MEDGSSVCNVVYLEITQYLNFEDCERRVIELKTIMFKSIYVWMIDYNSACFSNFLEFMDLYSSSSSFCVSLVYLGCTLCAFIFLYKKKILLILRAQSGNLQAYAAK